MKKSGLLVLLSLLAVLSGCQSVSEIPPELQYSRKASDIQNPAFIRGTNRKDAFPLFDDHTACVMTIDDKSIMDDRKKWNQELPLEPGHRPIEVLYYHGAFITKARFVLEAKPGAKYEVRFKVGKQAVDFWIVDLATDTAVTGIERGIMSGGGGGYVPIFIPVR